MSLSTSIYTLILSLLLCTNALAEPLKVVATFSILGDLATQIGKEHTHITTLVKPNSDAHVYDPTPSDVKTVQQAQVLIMNGLGFEGWIERLIQAANFKGKVIIASEGIQPLTETSADKKHNSHATQAIDPHAWQNVAHVQQYVQNIIKGLSEVDPTNAAHYEQTGADYLAQLKALDEWIRAEINSIPLEKRKVVTSHDAFAYFAAAYQVNIYAAQGINTDSQPSAKTIASLIKQMRAQQVKALFTENISDPRLLEQIAREAQGVIGEELYSDALSNPTEPAATYIQMMRHNVTALKKGMLNN